jgi:hypothetical protein
MKFDEVFLGTSRFDEVWEKGSCLHPEEKSTLEMNLEFFDLFIKI